MTTIAERLKLVDTQDFRDFFKRRNGINYPSVDGEDMIVIVSRIIDTMSDWVDELAKRVVP